MTTLFYNGTSIQIQEDDTSYRYRALMGEDTITLKFSLDRAIDFPVGTYMTFQGRTYTLTSPENWKRMGRSNLEYTLVLEGEGSTLAKYKLINQQDGRLKFSMTAKPAELLKLIVWNLNQRDAGWTPECSIESVEKTIEFNHTNLLDALNTIAETFETEYEISDGKVIKLGKIEYNKDNPLPLEMGKGKGFLSGTGRVNDSDSKPIDVLYVQGGDRNIDRSSYGSSELLLPKNQTIEYEGKSYISSEDGRSIRRVEEPQKYGNEDSIDLSDIYPKREGTISEVVLVDEKNNFYDFSDAEIPDDLDYNDHIIDGETMTVIFQSGMLAGKEFEISRYTHSSRTFEIVPQEVDGIVMPSGNFIPKAGDKYAIFGCTLPPIYISDIENKAGAEWDMFKEAARHLYDNSEYKFTFTGELQAKWVKENWENVGGRIKLGGYIRFKDESFAKDGVDIRITGIKDFLGSPYSPTIEISNNIKSASSISSALRKPSMNEVIIEERYKDAIAFSKRRYRDALETMDMLKDAMLENFGDDINPIAINTMQMIVGDQSLQFRFVKSRETGEVDDEHKIEYDSASKTLVADAGVLQHMTLGLSNEIKSSRSLDEYMFWNVSEFVSPYLGDGLAENSYYLYAKCSRTEETGEFMLSQRAIEMNSSGTDYYFLVGVLNKERNGERSFVPLYGYTEILPGQITTDVIRSADGTCVFDLKNNTITGAMKFLAGTSGIENIEGLPDMVQDAIGGLEISHYNLLRNSGFTGDFVTETLTGEDILEPDEQMFSDPLSHWQYSGAVVQDSEVSQSGKECLISNNGYISQRLQTKVIKGESYVISFRAKGTKAQIIAAGYSKTLEFSQDWQKYTIKFNALNDNNELAIINATCTLCEIQLERGNVPSAWGNSVWDNRSDLARYQSLQHLESAIKDGSSAFVGGLALTNLLLLGDTETKRNTAGVSGITEDDTDVAFWGGGTFEQAIATAMKYATNPSYQPTDAELAAMAKVVITHGGRAILNDVIVRGSVYAKDGKFSGTIESNSGHIGGFKIASKHLGVDNDGSSNGMFLFEEFIGFRDSDANLGARSALMGANVLTAYIGYPALAKFEADGLDDYNKNFGTAMGIISNIVNYKKAYAFYSEGGMFAGLRPATRWVSQADVTLLNTDYCIFVADMSATAILRLPATPCAGQEYIVETKGTDINLISSKSNMYSHKANNSSLQDTFKVTGRGVFRLKYYAEADVWTFCWIDTY